jgi:adenylate kinase family enzyme
MERGELLDDAFVVSLLSSRVQNSWDIKQNGVLLDGFPRSTEQAARIVARTTASVGGGEHAAQHLLRPDCVVVLERPDELVKEFALGRMTDSATGQTYHPIYAPPPAEVQARLVWRLDDTPQVIDRRCADFRRSVEDICDIFAAAGVPVKTFDNARSELDTFAEVAQFVEDTARHKLRESGGWNAVLQRLLGDLQTVELPLADQDDVLPLCDLGSEGEDACLLRWEEEEQKEQGEATPASAAGGHGGASGDVGSQGSEQASGFLRIARRCNSYDARDFLAVLVGNQQVARPPSRLHTPSPSLPLRPSVPLFLLPSLPPFLFSPFLPSSLPPSFPHSVPPSLPPSFLHPFPPSLAVSCAHTFCL